MNSGHQFVTTITKLVPDLKQITEVDYILREGNFEGKTIDKFVLFF